MSKYSRPARLKDYRIAVMCALEIESSAVGAMFDENWEKVVKYPKPEGDSNAYTMGRIGEHNVVLAYMPGIGKVNSAKVANSFKTTFPEIRLGLIVGICGGAPFIRKHHSHPREIPVWLGDIIISTEVVQYDLGILHTDELTTMDTLDNTLGRPNEEIRSFLHSVRSYLHGEELLGKTCEYLESFSKVKNFEKPNYQGVEMDILYKADFLHKHHDATDCSCSKGEKKVCQEAHDSTCEDLNCTSKQSVQRTRPKEGENNAAAPKPCIYFGPFASGDSVIKSAEVRDELVKSKNIFGFEMEGAGAWESMPIVVMKSVVDYADSHKSYRWQKYGSACAAACMKAFVTQWRPTQKTMQNKAGPSPYGHQERQTCESSEVTREKSKTPSISEDIKKQVIDDLDKEEALLQNPTKGTRTANMEAALQILLKAKDQKEHLDFSLRKQMYWDLMTVERDLSGSSRFRGAEKREHIRQAQDNLAEVKKIVQQLSDESLDAQVSLEQHKIEGRKATLDFEVNNDREELERLKLKATVGIDTSLRKLKEVDPKTHSEVFKSAMEWRKMFSC